MEATQRNALALAIENDVQEEVVVRWSLVDGRLSYMDTYRFTKEEWEQTTPDALQERQMNQYAAWRETMGSPIDG